MDNQERWYSYRDAPDAPELAGTGITERRLRAWVPAGKIPHHKFGEEVRFSTSDLRQFLADSAVPVRANG